MIFHMFSYVYIAPLHSPMTSCLCDLYVYTALHQQERNVRQVLREHLKHYCKTAVHERRPIVLSSAEEIDTALLHLSYTLDIHFPYPSHPSWSNSGHPLILSLYLHILLIML